MVYNSNSYFRGNSSTSSNQQQQQQKFQTESRKYSRKESSSQQQLEKLDSENQKKSYKTKPNIKNNNNNNNNYEGDNYQDGFQTITTSVVTTTTFVPQSDRSIIINTAQIRDRLDEWRDPLQENKDHVIELQVLKYVIGKQYCGRVSVSQLWMLREFFNGRRNIVMIPIDFNNLKGELVDEYISRHGKGKAPTGWAHVKNFMVKEFDRTDVPNWLVVNSRNNNNTNQNDDNNDKSNSKAKKQQTKNNNARQQKQKQVEEEEEPDFAHHDVIAVQDMINGCLSFLGLDTISF